MKSNKMKLLYTISLISYVCCLQVRRPFVRNPSNSHLFASVTKDTMKVKPPVPITLLGGFLGSGKTSALKNLLENRDGLKIGVIVNDVAAVNIDGKLLSNPNDVDLTDCPTVELQNGCACCSIADELPVSISKLMDGREFDALVVELSGVAHPQAVRSNWLEAQKVGNPVTKLAEMNNIVTLIDACTFGTDWMTWNTVGEREDWSKEADECSSQRKISELLAEQVECADVLLINKIDLAGEDQVNIVSGLASNLNKEAKIHEVSFGKIVPSKLLNVADEKEHSSECNNNDSTEHSHSHSHENSSSCNDPDCPSSHTHNKSSECTDPDCTDTSHSHDHAHDSGITTVELGISNFVYKSDRPFNTMRLSKLLNSWPVPLKDNLDFGLLQRASSDGFSADGKTLVTGNPFVGVLRSKGFCWLAPIDWTGPDDDAWRHDAAMYWSHAGKHFSIDSAGSWWGSISREEMKSLFVGEAEKEYERIIREDFVSEEFSDRRQEIVFIGTNINEDDIRKELDSCLLTDDELDLYREKSTSLNMSK